jgi:hypothetical protein
MGFARISLFSLAFSSVALTVPAGATQTFFYEHWGDGRAEISSYAVVQQRYGEMRAGYGVLIFVTEELNRQTLVKVESPTPAEERVYVLKMNNVLKFNTGIYDYSVMTSVFSAVDGYDSGEAFELCKINLSAQEWCGHVFDESRIRKGQLKGTLNSYFESEGRRDYELELPDRFESEDHLLIRIRELAGPWMESGQTRQVQLLQALWNFRLEHRPHRLVDARLAKGHPEEKTVSGRDYSAIPWTWTIAGSAKTVWVEDAHPRRILAWEDTDGGSGRLLKSIREPYWRLHSNADEVFREELEIP